MTETVLIMGAGAVAGVGGALAQKFAANGHHIIVAGRTQSKLHAIVEAVTNEGGSAEAAVADVTSGQDQDAVFDRVHRRGAPLAAVLYNAGSNYPSSFLI